VKVKCNNCPGVSRAASYSALAKAVPQELKAERTPLPKLLHCGSGAMRDQIKKRTQPDPDLPRAQQVRKLHKHDEKLRVQESSPIPLSCNEIWSRTGTRFG